MRARGSQRCGTMVFAGKMISSLSPALQGSTSDLAFPPRGRLQECHLSPLHLSPGPRHCAADNAGPWGAPQRRRVGRAGWVALVGAGGHGLAPPPSVSSHALRTPTQPAHALSVCDVGWQLSLGFPSSPPSCRHPRGNRSLCSASPRSCTAMGPWVSLRAPQARLCPRRCQPLPAAACKPYSQGWAGSTSVLVTPRQGIFICPYKEAGVSFP